MAIWQRTLPYSRKAPQESPRDLATATCKCMKADNDMIQSVDVAGPGFINIKLSKKVFSSRTTPRIQEGTQFGKTYEHKVKCH